LKRFVELFSKAETYSVYVAGIITFLLAAAIFIQVVMRLFRTGIPGLYEAGEASLVVIVFLSISWIQRGGHHIRMDMSIEKLPKKAKPYGNLVYLIIGLLVCGLFTWRLGLRAISDTITGSYQMGLVHIPYAPFRILMTLGCLMICIRLIIQIKEVFVDHISPGEEAHT
jgi:TRAP-type C4-dicarboxylate transport system permease small subunit